MYTGSPNIGKRFEMAFCETVLAMRRIAKLYPDNKLPDSVKVTVPLVDDITAEFWVPVTPDHPTQEPQSTPTQLTA